MSTWKAGTDGTTAPGCDPSARVAPIVKDMRSAARLPPAPVMLMAALLLLSAVMAAGAVDASVTIDPDAHSLSGSAPWWYRSLAVDGDTVHMCYGDGSQLYYANDTSGAMVTQLLPAGGGSECSLVMDGRGAAHISCTDDDRSLHYATNAGGPWSYETVDGTGGGSSRIAVDDGGVVHIAYIGTGLKYARGSAGAWDVTTLDEDGMDVHAMVLDSRGHAYVLYSDGANYRYASNADGSWDLKTVIDRSLILGGSMVLDAHDHVHFGLVNADYELLYANESTGVWNAQTVATSVRADSAYIAVDGGGHVHLTYTDKKRSVLRYATSADGSWRSSTIDDGGRAVYGGPIVVSADGRVHVLYSREDTAGDLVVWYAELDPQVRTAPNAPRDLAATADGNGVQLHWNAPTSDGGSALTGYRLYWSEGGGPFSSRLITGTEHRHEEAVNGRSYHYKVAALNAEGEGPTTDVVSVTLGGSSPYPSAPRNVTVVLEAGKAVLAWTQPEYGEVVTSYRIYRGTSTAVGLLSSTGSMSYEDGDVANGATYYYRISAMNGSVEGDLSDAVNVMIPSSPIDDIRAFLGTAPGVAILASVAAMGAGAAVHVVRRRRSR